MSDGATDGARATKYRRPLEETLRTILALLVMSYRDQKNRAPLMNQLCDELVQQGIKEDAASVLEKLRDGDEQTWYRVLEDAWKVDNESLFHALKAQSPWRNSLVLFVAYGEGRATTVEGELSLVIAKAIEMRVSKKSRGDSHVVSRHLIGILPFLPAGMTVVTKKRNWK